MCAVITFPSRQGRFLPSKQPHGRVACGHYEGVEVNKIDKAPTSCGDGARRPRTVELERLTQFGEMVRQCQETLATRITDSCRLPASFTRFDVQSLVDILTNYGDLLRLLENGGIAHPSWTGRPVDIAARASRGPIAALLPYNGPAMCFGLAYAPAVVLGENVWIKPARESQNFFQTLASLVADAGLASMLVNPDGSSVLSQSAGAAFLKQHLSPASTTKVLQIYGHDSYITESVKYRVMQKSPDFRLILEGPGKNRFIVTSSTTDLEQAAEAIARLGTVNGGQTCMGAEIFDVHEDVASELIPRIVEHVRALQVGDPYDPATTIGPIRPKMAGIICSQVEDALCRGAMLEFATERAGKEQLLTFGSGGEVRFTRPEYADGYVFVPAVVLSNVDDAMILRHQETFGPIIALRTFRDDSELISQIVESPYGLGATIFGEDLATRHGDLRQALQEHNGTVFENLYMFDEARGFDPLRSPWGGYKRSRFTLVPAVVDGHPGVTEVKTGPSFTFMDFSREGAGP